MRNKPRIRFKGFTEDWEQRKLGDFTNQINTFVNPEDAKLPLWSLTAEAGLIEKSDRYERDFLVKKKDQFKRIETNTLVYNPMNITIGSIDIYTGLYPIAVSGYYVSIVYDKNIDTDFLKEVLLLPSSLKMYKNYATGSLIERQRVQYPTFSKLQLLLPNLDEQKAIGQFFKSLNLDITLHQRKLEKLKLAKKALLQKLFPKNGSQFPEIRFKGFTDAWEQRKLGEVVKSYSGGTPTASNKEYYGGDIPFIRSAEINSDTTELYITKKGLDNSSAKIVEKGTILYAMYGATSGEVGISKINGAINQAILAMIPLDYGGKIIAQYLRKNKESIIGKYLQGGQGNLSANIILELPIQLPEVKESDKIAYFLESVDKLITLHQRKLDKLQEVKKGLLQKMFV